MHKKPKLSEKTKNEITLLLERYVEGVFDLQAEINRRHKAGENLFVGLDLAFGAAFGTEKDFNHRSVTKQTEQLLVEACNLILDKTELRAHLGFSNLFESLKKELGKEILYSEHKKKSMHRVLQNTLSRLSEKVEKNALFVFPIIYSHKSETMRFDFGPLAFMDMESFLGDDVAEKLVANKEEIDEGFEDRYGNAWEAVKKRAKHVVTVHLQGYELEKGKVAARRAVEFFLNALRLSFKWEGEFKIKVLDHNIQETMTPSFVLLEDGKFSKSLYGAGSEYIFLKDGVSIKAIEALSEYHPILASIIDGMVSNSSSRSVVLQQIEYASFLIKTAFQQDSVRIALVNFVSGLESLACLSGQSKKADLSKRCQLVGLGTSDEDRKKSQERCSMPTIIETMWFMEMRSTKTNIGEYFAT